MWVWVCVCGRMLTEGVCVCVSVCVCVLELILIIFAHLVFSCSVVFASFRLLNQYNRVQCDPFTGPERDTHGTL